MKKFLRLGFLTFLITNLYFLSVQAQENPDPDDPDLPPVLTNVELNDVDSKELFDVLNKWNIVMTDRQTQTKKIQTTEVTCVENMEGGRQLGCSLFDELHSRDLTKYNKNADPLFKVLVKHMPMECEEDSETCLLSAETLGCSVNANKYLCSIEVLIPQPKNKKGDRK